MPSTIEQVHRDFKDRGLSVLAINIQEDRETVARWVKSSGITLPVLLDGSGAVTRAYEVTGTPTVFLLGRDGKLVGRAIGDRGWMTDRGKALLRALVSS